MLSLRRGSGDEECLCLANSVRSVRSDGSERSGSACTAGSTTTRHRHRSPHNPPQDPRPRMLSRRRPSRRPRTSARPSSRRRPPDLWHLPAAARSRRSQQKDAAPGSGPASRRLKNRKVGSRLSRRSTSGRSGNRNSSSLNSLDHSPNPRRPSSIGPPLRRPRSRPSHPSPSQRSWSSASGRDPTPSRRSHRSPRFAMTDTWPPGSPSSSGSPRSSASSAARCPSSTARKG